MKAVLAILTTSCLALGSLAAQEFEAWRVVHPAAGTQPPAADAAAWVDLATWQSREWRLEHRPQPGLRLWLDATLPAPEAALGEWVVIEIPNHRVIEDAWLDGRELDNLSDHMGWVVPSGEAVAVVRAGSRPELTGLDRHTRGYVWWKTRFDQPARYVVPRAQLAAGSRLVLEAFDFELPDHGLLGTTRLRALTIEDLLTIDAFSRPVAAFESETVVTLGNRVPGLHAEVELDIRVEDRFGVVCREETRRVRFDGERRHDLFLQAQDGDEHVAVITARWNGQRGEAYHAYLQPYVHQRDGRPVVELDQHLWRSLPRSIGDQLSAEAPEQGWQGFRYHHRAGGKAPHKMYARARFAAPAALTGERILLRIGLLEATGEVWLNGQHLGRVDYTDCPATLDATAAFVPGGDNELLVGLQDWSAFLVEGTPQPKDGESTPPRGTSYASFALGINLGVDQVSFAAVPAARIVAARVTPAVAAGELRVTTVLRNDGTLPVELRPEHVVRDGAREVLRFAGDAVTVPPGEELTVEAVHPAELETWHPERPRLYALETSVAGDRLVDRFGWREVGTEGDRITLNGAPIHLRGASGLGQTNNPSLRRELSWLRDQLGERAEAGFNTLRIGMKINSLGAFHGVCDEVGMFSRIVSSMDDMTRGFIAYLDPRLHANNTAMLIGQGAAHWNHPSIIFYDNGNEVYYYWQSPKALAPLMHGTEQAVRAFDPTRLVIHNGSHDLSGLAAIDCPHYGSTGIMPVGWLYLRNQREAAPEALRRRALAGLPAAPVPSTERKPIYNGEFLWLHHDNLPGEGYGWMGEQALKSTPEWRDNTFPIAAVVAGITKSSWRWKAERLAHTAGGTLLGSPLSSRRNAEPVLAVLLEEGTRHFADRPIERTLGVINDAREERTIDVALSLDGLQVFADRYTLASGARERVTITIDPPSVDAPTTVDAVLTASVDGRELSRRVQHWTVFPRSWVGAVDATVAVHDPSGAVQAMLPALGAGSLVLDDLAALDAGGIGTLVLGEDLDRETFATHGQRLRDWVGQGGRLLVLRQPAGIEGLLPIALEPSGGYNHNDGSGNGDSAVRSALFAPHHPAFDGTLDDDLAQWGRYGVVVGTGYRMPEGGAFRVLAGLNPSSAHLLEFVHGAGRAWFTTLELTEENVRIEPAAARILANLLRIGQVPAAVETVVVAPAGAERRRLLEALHLRAEVLEPGAALGADALVVLAGWHDQAPPAELAPRLRAHLEAGGRVLLQEAGPATAQWLAAVVGQPVTWRDAIAVRAHKVAAHPLIDGVADGDLARTKTVYRQSLIRKETSEQDLLRGHPVIPGARVLTEPAVLQVAKVGAGTLVVDQSRTLTTRNERGDRVLTALLVNLGARLDFPPPPEAARPIAGLTVTPLPLGAAANHSRYDEQQFDGEGFIDFGANAQFALPSGQFLAQGATFALADEDATGGRSLIALRAGEQILAHSPPKMLIELERVSQPIAVDRHAESLFFLHTAAYPVAPKGTPLMEYEVRYAGYSKLIPGDDLTPYVQLVPVRNGIDIGDWTTKEQTVPGAQAFSVPGRKGPRTVWAYVQRFDNPWPEKRIESIVARTKAVGGAPIVVAISTANPAENLLGPWDELPDYHMVWTGGKPRPQGGSGWDAGPFMSQFWSNDSSGEAWCRVVDERRVLALRNTGGRPSGFLHAGDKITLAPGRYSLRFAYRTRDDMSNLRLGAKGKGNELVVLGGDLEQAKKGWTLPATTEWRTVSLAFELVGPTATIPLELAWFNQSNHEDNLLELSGIAIYPQ